MLGDNLRVEHRYIIHDLVEIKVLVNDGDITVLCKSPYEADIPKIWSW